MRPARFCTTLLVLCLAGCGEKKPAAVPASPAQAPQPLPEIDAGELFTKALPQGMQARVTRREYAGYQQGGTFFVDGGFQFFLTVTNATAAPARARCPKHLLGTFEKWKNPYAGEARAPEHLYLLIVRDGELKIPAGGEARVEITEVRYLGNTNRPQPAGEGAEPELKVEVPPADSAYVRLAEALEQAKPPLKPWFHGLAYSLIADASPDAIQRGRVLAWEWVGIAALRDLFDRAGVKPRLHGLFAEADAKRNAILEKLRAATDAGAALQALDARSCEGDVEAAVAFAAFVKPEERRDGTSMLPRALGKLNVRDPRVLDTLFRFAVRDGDEFSRIEAAIAGAQLGDPRCVPLLVQYSRNPAMADDDVAQLGMRCTGVLVDLWLAQGKFVRDGDWKAAIHRFGGMDAPDLKGLAPEERAELNAFLESGKNLRRKAEK